MAYGLDIVAIGIQDKGAIIVVVIMRPEARCAMVLAAGRHSRFVKGIDTGTILGGECDMCPGNILANANPEIGLALGPVTGSRMIARLLRSHFHDQGDP